ncbi:kinectin isoform X4 [Monodelphis domestica]|uniref:kinectin isoform X4 n=1 Tax=Monodelphis domestica TaxID=13616 RepID=UPI0007B3FB4F|nr:kinectin isoform X4 [Monodelphis domestica]
MEFYESTYFIILIPSVVITVIFLFFWLFMKETLYDEVLAKQKREQKLLPTKTDKKKAEKKKNKKKETQNGNLHESDSENVSREFKVTDALCLDDEQVTPVQLGVVEASIGVRERKKKEKKHKPVQEEQTTKESDVSKSPGKKVEPIPVTKQPTPPSEASSSKKKPGQKKPKNGIDDQDKKIEVVLSPTKKQEPLPLQQETKESGSGKKKNSSKKQKIDNAMVDDHGHSSSYTSLMDNSDSNPAADKREVMDLVKSDQVEGTQKTGAKKLKNETDKENAEVKFKDFLLSLKNMTFSETEALCVVDLLREKSGAIQDALKKFSKSEVAVVLHQLQEKEKLLSAAKEDAIIAKDRYKHLAQELLTEKDRSTMVITRMKERIDTLEKELNILQNKIHGRYQEVQQMQMKFQKVREQMEAEIAHLKQENAILRDAVSNTTNQIESKQSSELNKLRQEYARLANELTEKTGKLQQEEIQKKNAEQAVAQLKVQLQEAERRWEEVQSYIRKRTSEHEATQQDLQNKYVAKENEVQGLHSKLTDTLVSKQQLEKRLMQLMESEQKRVKKEDSLQMQAQTSASVLAEELHKVIAEKDKQIKQTEDSLANEHDHLTSKEEELKVIQNMNFFLKAEVQKLQALTNEQAAVAHELEKMQKSINVKDDKIRSLEEQLQSELKHKMEEFKILKDQNKALQIEFQKLQAIIAEQANKDVVEQMERSIQEKDEKLKTVEELLETGLIQVANKEEELKVLRTENSSLKNEVQSLQAQLTAQVSFTAIVDELHRIIREKDGKIKSVEELMQAELIKVANKEKTVQALKQEIEALKEEVGNIQLEKAQQGLVASQIQELQKLLKGKEEHENTMKAVLEEKEKDLVNRGNLLQDLQDENASLKAHVQEMSQQLQQVSSASQIQELENILKSKEDQMKLMEETLKEKDRDLFSKGKLLQNVQDENKHFKSQLEALEQQNYQQMSSVPPHEEMLKMISAKENEVTGLQNEVEALKNIVEQQRKKNNDLREKNWKAMEALASTEKMLQDKVNKTAKERHQLEAVETEAKEILKKLFPGVSIPSNLNFSEWLQKFEKKAKEYAIETYISEDIKVLQQKLKEAEEMHTMLQLECETYKSVLAETEGILQRLQQSVEQEENKWKFKVEESQKAVRQIHFSLSSLEQEVERLRGENKELETLRREREHLESELEKAEIERSTYVSEVRELKDLLTELQKKLDDSYSEAVRQNEELNLLKTQLNETLTKLKMEQSERQKVAGDLHKAQQSLDLIQSEIVRAAGDTSIIENSDVSSEVESSEKERISISLNQTVTQLQQLLQAVNQQLTKE